MSISIGVVGGTGALGSALAYRLLKHGYSVTIGSRSKERGSAKAEELRLETDGTVTGGDNGIAVQCDFIVLAVPATEAITLLEPFRADLQNKTLIDVTVPLKFGRFIKVDSADELSNYELIRSHFSESNVVACLKTIPADFLRQDGSKERRTTFVFSKTHESAIPVMSMLETIGLEPVYVPGKYHAYTVERMTAMAIQLNKEYPGSHIGYKVVGLVK